MAHAKGLTDQEARDRGNADEHHYYTRLQQQSHRSTPYSFHEGEAGYTSGQSHYSETQATPEVSSRQDTPESLSMHTLMDFSATPLQAAETYGATFDTRLLPTTSQEEEDHETDENLPDITKK